MCSYMLFPPPPPPPFMHSWRIILPLAFIYHFNSQLCNREHAHVCKTQVDVNKIPISRLSLSRRLFSGNLYLHKPSHEVVPVLGSSGAVGQPEILLCCASAQLGFGNSTVNWATEFAKAWAGGWRAPRATRVERTFAPLEASPGFTGAFTAPGCRGYCSMRGRIGANLGLHWEGMESLSSHHCSPMSAQCMLSVNRGIRVSAEWCWRTCSCPRAWHTWLDPGMMPASAMACRNASFSLWRVWL